MVSFAGDTDVVVACLRDTRRSCVLSLQTVGELETLFDRFAIDPTTHSRHTATTAQVASTLFDFGARCVACVSGGELFAGRWLCRGGIPQRHSGEEGGLEPFQKWFVAVFGGDTTECRERSGHAAGVARGQFGPAARQNAVFAQVNLQFFSVLSMS